MILIHARHFTRFKQIIVVNVLVIIVQIRIHQTNNHTKVTQNTPINTIVLDVIAVIVVLVRTCAAFRQYFICDMVEVLNNQSGQSKRTTNYYSSHFRRIFCYFKCPVLNFINFSCATPARRTRTRTTTATTFLSAVIIVECLSLQTHIPNEQEISSHRTNNNLSLSSILFPVSTERQLVIIFCIVYRKDYIITPNIKMNNINALQLMDADAMVKYLNNNTIYNLFLFICFNDACRRRRHYLLIFTTTILYLAFNEFNLILSLISWSIVSYCGGKSMRTSLEQNVRSIRQTNLIAKCWTHKMGPALKNSMIFAL